MKAHIKGPNNLKISACTIAKNEEQTIARSIESYKKYVDEIIVVDTGSTDATVEVAARLGARVIRFAWCDDFAAAKNCALDAAAGDWIVFLDADEYFADDCAKSLHSVIAEAESLKKTAVGCRMENVDTDTGSNIADGFSIRIFKKGTRYRYAVHEEIANPDGIYAITVGKSRLYLKHTGYSSSIVASKCERNLEIMLRQLACEKEDRRIITYYSYISDSYFGMGRFKEAREYAEKYLEQSKIKNISILGCEIRPYLNIIQSLETQKADPEEITPYAEELLSRYADCPDAHYAAGRDLMRRMRFAKALEEFQKALELSENFSGVYVNTVVTQIAQVYNLCGNCEEALLNPTGAMSWYFKAFQEADYYQQALFNLLRIVRNMPRAEIDGMVRSMFTGASPKKQLALLSALMCNYMTPQLIECYAAYRSIKGQGAIDADVTAFIKAGEGDYVAAARFFLLNNKANGNAEMAERAFICAVLSGETELIAQAGALVGPIVTFALSLSPEPELTNENIEKIGGVFSKLNSMGKAGVALEKLEAVCPRLCDAERMKLSECLSRHAFQEAALLTARFCALTPRSVFLQGYFLYRMGRFFEAADDLLLAKSMGCDDPALDEIYNALAAARPESLADAEREKAAALRRAVFDKIEEGDFSGAHADLITYKRMAEADAQLLTAEATLLYYSGRFLEAAAAVQSGLLKDGHNFDLLYNAGCIYDKLGEIKKAAAYYRQALEACTDDEAAQEIKQSLLSLKNR